MDTTFLISTSWVETETKIPKEGEPCLVIIDSLPLPIYCIFSEGSFYQVSVKFTKKEDKLCLNRVERNVLAWRTDLGVVVKRYSSEGGNTKNHNRRVL